MPVLAGCIQHDGKTLHCVHPFVCSDVRIVSLCRLGSIAEYVWTLHDYLFGIKYLRLMCSSVRSDDVINQN